LVRARSVASLGNGGHQLLTGAMNVGGGAGETLMWGLDDLRRHLARGVKQRDVLFTSFLDRVGGAVADGGKGFHRLRIHSFAPRSAYTGAAQVWYSMTRNRCAAAADERALGRVCTKRSIRIVVDNTIMKSMLLRKPCRPASRVGGVRQYCSI